MNLPHSRIPNEHAVTDEMFCYKLQTRMKVDWCQLRLNLIMYPSCTSRKINAILLNIKIN